MSIDLLERRLWATAKQVDDEMDVVLCWVK